jgi:hypothetical protein
MVGKRNYKKAFQAVAHLWGTNGNCTCTRLTGGSNTDEKKCNKLDQKHSKNTFQNKPGLIHEKNL